MQTHHKHFVWLVVLWAELTDGDWSGEECWPHDEADISRGGDARGMLRIAKLPQNLCPQKDVSPPGEDLDV